LDGEGDFDIAQMKISILETMEAEFRVLGTEENVFQFQDFRTGGCNPYHEKFV
jgi:hypothetical protein